MSDEQQEGKKRRKRKSPLDQEIHIRSNNFSLKKNAFIILKKSYKDKLNKTIGSGSTAVFGRVGEKGTASVVRERLVLGFVRVWVYVYGGVGMCVR